MDIHLLQGLKNTRKKYKYKSFIIDVDRLSFGYEMCEIEKA